MISKTRKSRLALLLSPLLALSLPSLALPVSAATPSPPPTSTTLGWGLGLGQPQSITNDGTNTWITGTYSNSITELAPDGSLVREIPTQTIGLLNPTKIVYAAGSIWVTSSPSSSIKRLDASSGALVSSVAIPSTTAPVLLAVSGTTLYAQLPTKLIAIDTTTGKKISSTPSQLILPQSMIAQENGTLFESNGSCLYAITPSTASISRYRCDLGQIKSISAAGTVLAVAGSNQAMTLNTSDLGVLTTASIPPTSVSITTDGTNLYTSAAQGLVRVTSAATGAFIKDITLPGPASPSTVAVFGSNLSVLSIQPTTLTQIDTTTLAVSRSISGSDYGFSGGPVVDDGIHTWILNGFSNTITELDSSTNAVLRVLASPNYNFSGVFAGASDGSHLWVLSTRAEHTLTEIDQTTGADLADITLAGDFSAAQTVAADQRYVYLGTWSSAILRVSVATHAVKVISGLSYHFATTDAITDDGTNVFVSNVSSGKITELKATSSALVRIFRPSPIAHTLTSFPSIHSDGTYLWVAYQDQGGSSGEIDQYSPATSTLVKAYTAASSPTVGSGISDITSNGTTAWAYAPSGSLVRIDASTHAVTSYANPLYALGGQARIGLFGSRLWVSLASGAVTKFTLPQG